LGYSSLDREGIRCLLVHFDDKGALTDVVLEDTVVRQGKDLFYFIEETRMPDFIERLGYV
jgi:uncharacterized protein (UPF0264 family)